MQVTHRLIDTSPLGFKNYAPAIWAMTQNNIQSFFNTRYFCWVTMYSNLR